MSAHIKVSRIVRRRGGQSRSAPYKSVRYAGICKDASRRYQPPRLRAILESLMRAASPPWKGGEYASLLDFSQPRALARVGAA